ncbi:hypothetical protein OOT46_26360 [Aquabacterium sp. A7-Y]|uniref:hypothetical protein n=1 Tax=Aquabacterium sp. A7-Y TaxID=1349605 RepID=UPI00223E4289|nr:hypothetical protein [Aquabacterium sp. A7-Y]MCW7541339.1 hypothetical protein [Aquabacterium sp. A7-Y]
MTAVWRDAVHDLRGVEAVRPRRAALGPHSDASIDGAAYDAALPDRQRETLY